MLLAEQYQVFFFSSSRRHTRSKRDWSSDVCSSDLRGCPGGRHFPRIVMLTDNITYISLLGVGFTALMCFLRSEERRVGKECRPRGSPEEVMKKYKPAHVAADISTSYALAKRRLVLG